MPAPPAYCPTCRAPIVWTITQGGKRLAVDATPDEGGNTAVYRDGIGTWRSRRPTEELPLMSYERLYVPHVATCPDRAPEPDRAPDMPRCLGVIRLDEHRRRRRDD